MEKCKFRLETLAAVGDTLVRLLRDAPQLVSITGLIQEKPSKWTAACLSLALMLSALVLVFSKGLVALLALVLRKLKICHLNETQRCYLKHTLVYGAATMLLVYVKLSPTHPVALNAVSLVMRIYGLTNLVDYCGRSYFGAHRVLIPAFVYSDSVYVFRMFISCMWGIYGLVGGAKKARRVICGLVILCTYVVMFIVLYYAGVYAKPLEMWLNIGNCMFDGLYNSLLGYLAKPARGETEDEDAIFDEPTDKGDVCVVARK